MSQLHDADSTAAITEGTVAAPPLDVDWRIPRWMKIAIAGFLVFVAAAMAFAIFEPIQVLPRMRLAPGYVLVDDQGASVISDDLRGTVTLYAFSSSTCGESCASVDATMAELAARAGEIDLGDVEFQLVTLDLDPVAAATPQGRAWRQSLVADSPTAWRVLSADEATLSSLVGDGFSRYYDPSEAPEARFDPGFVLVDGAGVVRGDYRYATLADDTDKLLRHLDLLGSELRNANGLSSAAYEAAHLFLCYP